MQARSGTGAVPSLVRRTLGAMVLAGCSLLVACDRPEVEMSSAAPVPIEYNAAVDPETTGYYGGQLMAEAGGPQGQIHLTRRSRPLWFASVRDTINFLGQPDEPRDITAVYVRDAGQDETGKQGGGDAWVEARAAWYVVGSDARGHHGIPAMVAFAEYPPAQDFQAVHGGKLLRLDEISKADMAGS